MMLKRYISKGLGDFFFGGSVRHAENSEGETKQQSNIVNVLLNTTGESVCNVTRTCKNHGGVNFSPKPVWPQARRLRRETEGTGKPRERNQTMAIQFPQ
jgi:hypothetical protein